jgi:hypothetical protein
MRYCHFVLGSVLLAMVLPAGGAKAGDMQEGDYPQGGMPQPADAGFYGNLHTTFGIDETLNPSVVYLPYGTVGGKIAYEAAPQDWGFQADLDYKYSDITWSSPQVAGLTGNQSEVDSAIHATYTIDNSKKFGFFTGYSGRNTSLVTSTVSNTTNYGVQGVGAEGLMAVGEGTALQIRAAILVPIYDNVVINSGGGPVTTGSLGPDFGHLGYMVAAGASQQLRHNISARVDATYANFTVKDIGANISEMNAQLSTQYTFESIPLSWGAAVGYGRETVNGTSNDTFTATNRLTYSFGGPAEGVHGRLFRSGVLGWAN